MFYTYALFSKSLDRSYIGQTGNLERRLNEHLSELSTYTKRSDDWELVYHEAHTTRSGAMKREKQLKYFRGREYIRKLMSEGC